jgi:hypothetical protein
MSTATAVSKKTAPKPVPVPDADFYQLIEHLTPEEKAVVAKVRTYMQSKVQPIINKYWSDDAFPFVADYNVARFFSDAEALYSYEGTYQMQNLILGKAITGHGAFV